MKRVYQIVETIIFLKIKNVKNVRKIVKLVIIINNASFAKKDLLILKINALINAL